MKIHTDEGITGIGEVTSQSYVCKAIFEAPQEAYTRALLAAAFDLKAVEAQAVAT